MSDEENVEAQEVTEQPVEEQPEEAVDAVEEQSEEAGKEVVDAVEETGESVEAEKSKTTETAENEEHQAPEEEEEEDNEDEDNLSDVDENDTFLDYTELSKLKASRRKTEALQTGPLRKQKDDEEDFEDKEASIPHQTLDESIKKRHELEEKFERALKRPKIKRKKDEEDLTNDDDEMIQILKQQMDAAAKKDAELIENSSGIAINKVKLLPKVRDVLSKVNLAEVILDNNLLAEVRQWLEPLPDASLPSYEIQKTLFTALMKLPINTNHLRESGIGKILLFYQKSKRVEPRIKRVADKLISDWTRPIIGASDNYRDKRIHGVDFDARRLKIKANKPHKLTAEEKRKREADKSIYEQQAARRNRAAAPAPTVTDYRFAPRSNVDKAQQSIVTAGVGSSLNRDDQFKRINQKLSGRKGTSKKGGISIEGRGLGI